MDRHWGPVSLKIPTVFTRRCWLSLQWPLAKIGGVGKERELDHPVLKQERPISRSRHALREAIQRGGTCEDKI
jgi:hypothetical protein